MDTGHFRRPESSSAVYCICTIDENRNAGFALADPTGIFSEHVFRKGSMPHTLTHRRQTARATLLFQFHSGASILIWGVPIGAGSCRTGRTEGPSDLHWAGPRHAPALNNTRQETTDDPLKPNINFNNPVEPHPVDQQRWPQCLHASVLKNPRVLTKKFALCTTGKLGSNLPSTRRQPILNLDSTDNETRSLSTRSGSAAIFLSSP